MASLINPTNIDVTYPIAGQDNDTQGFRDNFSSIKNNLNTAKNEISAIQSTLSSTLVLISAPTSTGSNGAIGQSSIGFSYYTPTVANTYSAGNLIKVSAITNLEQGQTVTFNGNLGGLLTTNTYYIKSIFSNGNIRVSTTRATSDDEAVTLSTASGSITANASSYYMYTCVGTDTWRRTILNSW